MAHKQLLGLKDQLGLINYQLGEVKKLEAEAPKAGASAPFPVVMSATVVALSLDQARQLLDGAKAMLEGEISFYEESDRKIAEIEAGAGDDKERAAAVEAETKTASSREALTAGRAAYAMQAVAAASVFMLKGMEKARSYRS